MQQRQLVAAQPGRAATPQRTGTALPLSLGGWGAVRSTGLNTDNGFRLQRGLVRQQCKSKCCPFLNDPPLCLGKSVLQVLLESVKTRFSPKHKRTPINLDHVHLYSGFGD